VAFGAFAGGGTIVALIIAAALVALVVWFVRHTGTPLAWLPTGLLLGGALGNLIDRLRLGFVVDFVDAGIGSLRWYTFNVADAGISFAILLLLAGSLWPSVTRQAPDHG
jgi:signal peptidase II